MLPLESRELETGFILRIVVSGGLGVVRGARVVKGAGFVIGEGRVLTDFEGSVILMIFVGFPLTLLVPGCLVPLLW